MSNLLNATELSKVGTEPNFYGSKVHSLNMLHSLPHLFL